MMEAFLLRYDRAPRLVRWLLMGLVAVVAALVLHLAVARPVWDHAERTGMAVDSVRRELEEGRRRLAGRTLRPDRIEDELDRLQARLTARADSLPAGLETGLLGQLTTLAEEEGARDPIFNPGGTGWETGLLRRFRIVALLGEFEAGTGAVAGFVGGLGRLSLPVVVDSIGLDGRPGGVDAFVRMLVLAPGRGGDTGAD